MDPMPWEVWLANVEFEESSEAKKRPVVIIDKSQTLVTALECTSKPPKNHGDFELDWQHIGLKYKTVVKPHKKLYLSRTTLIHKIGDLGLADITMIMDYKKPHRNERVPYTHTNGKYNRPENTNGCYVATSIYGSYDCPQVWTLRRYRDYSLSKTWYGCGFIILYYTLSPIFVKWFGKTRWFKRFWRNRLDSLVGKLNSRGYNDTPYYDIKE